MCVAYHIGSCPTLRPDNAHSPFTAEERLVRRGDSAPVFFGGGESTVMRWGFRSSRDSAIHQTRADSLGSGMWAEAFRNRRCLIPMSDFIEDSAPQGQESIHRFERPDGILLLAAGVWENSLQGGRTFSIITTQANALIGAFHPRLPALLDHDSALAYLAGDLSEFAPFPGALAMKETSDPMKKSAAEAGRF